MALSKNNLFLHFLFVLDKSFSMKVVEKTKFLLVKVRDEGGVIGFCGALICLNHLFEL